MACGKKIHISYLVKLLEKNFNSKIRIKYLKLQKGDVKNTFSDTKKLKKYLGKINHTKFSDGIKNFCDWYKDYY